MTDADALSRPAAPPDQPITPQRLMAQAIAAHRANRLAEAVALYGRVLTLDPASRGAANNMGVALRSLGRREAAEAFYRRCLALDDGDASAWVNLGNVLRDLGRLDEAAAAHHRALAIDPKARGAMYGLGLVARDTKRLPESLDWLQRAVALAPEDPDLNWDLALTLMCMGDFPRGWDMYEWRWRLKGVRKPHLGTPEWDGAVLDGRPLLLYGEQGFGDVIQFARFAPLAAARAQAPVILHVRPPLVPLLDGQLPGVTAVVPNDAPPPAHAASAPLLSVPRLLRLGRDDVPRGSYLKPVPRRVALPAPPPGTRLKVALCWQGSPTHKNDRNRSMPFAALLPLLRHSGVAFYSMQKADAARDPAQWGVSPLVPDLDPVLGDFADSSAVLAAMDVLVSVETSVMHLAAAMGKPAWVLLPVLHDWRFDAEDSIDTWYSSVRVFKQSTPGDWSGPVAAVSAALDTLLGTG